MNNPQLKKAFSLAETIVFVIVSAIIIAAATPLITRKIVNIQDAGTTLGGGQHGRIEIYTKEIVTFGNDSYEKIVNNPSIGEIFTVYERKDDEFYKKTQNAEPKTDNKGNKSTIYEEIQNATPIKDQQGNIIAAKKIVDGKEEVYKKSTKYIFEDNNITYIKGTLVTDANGKNDFEQTGPKLSEANKHSTNKL